MSGPILGSFLLSPAKGGAIDSPSSSRASASSEPSSDFKGKFTMAQAGYASPSEVDSSAFMPLPVNDKLLEGGRGDLVNPLNDMGFDGLARDSSTLDQPVDDSVDKGYDGDTDVSARSEGGAQSVFVAPDSPIDAPNISSANPRNEDLVREGAIHVAAAAPHQVRHHGTVAGPVMGSAATDSLIKQASLTSRSVKVSAAEEKHDQYVVSGNPVSREAADWKSHKMESGAVSAKPDDHKNNALSHGSTDGLDDAYAPTSAVQAVVNVSHQVPAFAGLGSTSSMAMTAGAFARYAMSKITESTDRGSGKEFTVNLYPKNLGDVSLKVTNDNGNISVQINTSNEAVSVIRDQVVYFFSKYDNINWKLNDKEFKSLKREAEESDALYSGSAGRDAPSDADGKINITI